MAPNNAYQSFVIIDYVSPFAPHKMKIPTKQYSNSAFIDPGTFETWDGMGEAGDSMVEDMITALADCMPPNVTYAGYTIYKKSSPTDLGVPAFSKSLSVIGTSANTGWQEAVQQTFVFRTTGYGIAKLILLDAKTDGLFGRYTTISGAYAALAAVFQNPARGWSGRDALQPAVFKLTTSNINEKLRREYHIT